MGNITRQQYANLAKDVYEQQFNAFRRPQLCLGRLKL